MLCQRYLSSLVLASVLLLCTSCKENIPVPRTNNPTSHNSAVAAAVSSSRNESAKTFDPNAPVWTHPRSDERADERKRMVDVLRQRYGMTDPNILRAMEAVPRHWFVPANVQRSAYVDGPQPIGYGQTISQPFIVAYMTQLLELLPESKVLEIGTGSGYQAAVLTEFTPHVYTIEIVQPLGKRAMATFKQRSYNTIRAKIGDGYKGWSEHAPFDAVIVTCAPDHIPKPLIDQLKPGGRIVIPVGSQWGVQDLMLVTKNKDGKLKRQSKMPVRFVPLTRD
ncbi:MAG: protein-L-isoaspartate(D-aspartate) O-methyltransferase [Phycisphaerae bacterium]|nr:protein-L-isoaspartate(D-aspartate) O-methyltransferase [Phycisphaerae bacterium]